MMSEFLSVKDFGAIGDGNVDDSAAFQAALDRHAAIHVPAAPAPTSSGCSPMSAPSRPHLGDLPC